MLQSCPFLFAIIIVIQTCASCLAQNTVSHTKPGTDLTSQHSRLGDKASSAELKERGWLSCPSTYITMTWLHCLCWLVALTGPWLHSTYRLTLRFGERVAEIKISLSFWIVSNTNTLKTLTQPSACSENCQWSENGKGKTNPNYK